MTHSGYGHVSVEAFSQQLHTINRAVLSIRSWLCEHPEKQGQIIEHVKHLLIRCDKTADRWHEATHEEHCVYELEYNVFTTEYAGRRLPLGTFIDEASICEQAFEVLCGHATILAFVLADCGIVLERSAEQAESRTYLEYDEWLCEAVRQKSDEDFIKLEALAASDNEESEPEYEPEELKKKSAALLSQADARSAAKKEKQRICSAECPICRELYELGD